MFHMLQFSLGYHVSSSFVSFLQIAVIDPMKKGAARSGQGVPLGGIGYIFFSLRNMCLLEILSVYSSYFILYKIFQETYVHQI